MRAWPYDHEGRLLEDSRLSTARCNKQTPLHRAARTGHLDVMVRLFYLGADPNAVDYFGRTALCLAAHHGNVVLFRELRYRMAPGAQNRTDRNGRNALHYAVLNHREEAALDLIENGIDINAEDFRGGSPLWYAAWNDMKKVLESLLTKDEISLAILSRERWAYSGKLLTPEERACQIKIARMAVMLRGPEQTRVDWEELRRRQDKDLYSVHDLEALLDMAAPECLGPISSS